MRTHDTLSGVFNISIATDIVSNMIKRCVNGITGSVNKIKQKFTESSPTHFDKTETHVDKNCVGFMAHQIANLHIWTSVSSKIEIDLCIYRPFTENEKFQR